MDSPDDGAKPELVITMLESFDWFTWVYLPLIVFATRVLDVTLGTMRIIFLSRGRKYLAPLLGFVEVLIWITVVSQIVGGANNLVAYVSYASGFAVGNYVGMLMEDKLAIGTLVIRIILNHNGKALIDNLHAGGYGVTYVDGHGATGPVILVYTVVMRKELERVIEIIESASPKSFFTVEELRSVRQGIFPARGTVPLELLIRRKSK
jgi:uncharacterized protein YebE (UPF0316 family)